MARYVVVDEYEGREVLIETNDLNKAYEVATERYDDTDGECDVDIRDNKRDSIDGGNFGIIAWGDDCDDYDDESEDYDDEDEDYSDEDYDDDCDNSGLKQMCEILEKMGLGIMSDNPNFRAYCKMLERKGLGIVIDF